MEELGLAIVKGVMVITSIIVCINIISWVCFIFLSFGYRILHWMDCFAIGRFKGLSLFTSGVGIGLIC